MSTASDPVFDLANSIRGSSTVKVATSVCTVSPCTSKFPVIVKLPVNVSFWSDLKKAPSPPIFKILSLASR